MNMKVNSSTVNPTGKALLNWGLVMNIAVSLIADRSTAKEL
jgi:hypothetical protein